MTRVFACENSGWKPFEILPGFILSHPGSRVATISKIAPARSRMMAHQRLSRVTRVRMLRTCKLSTHVLRYES